MDPYPPTAADFAREGAYRAQDKADANAIELAQLQAEIAKLWAALESIAAMSGREAMRVEADPRDAEIARLRHHISRAWVNLSCGMVDAAQRELEQAHPR